MKFLESAPTAVVIPVHGGLPLTVRCLDSLRNCDPLPVMVVVVDDGSPDDTAAHLATHYPDVHVVPGDGNLWWGGATNVGCKYAIERGADTLILLNNDNIDLSENLLRELVRLLKERGGCVGATTLMETSDGRRKIFGAGGVLDWRGRGTILRRSGESFRESDSVTECDWLPGMALAFEADLFSRLGGIDAATFPQSRGDADFTLRARKLDVSCVASTACWIVNDRTQVPFGFSRRLRVRDFFRGLVMRNSNYQLRTTVHFFLRHCPRRWLIPALVLFYARYGWAWLKTQRISSVQPTAKTSHKVPPVATTTSPLRVALVIWSGDIGGAETLAVALARALRDSGVDARVVFVTRAEPLARRFLEAGVPFAELRLKRGRAVLWHARRFAQVVAAGGADGAVLVAGGFLALALRLGGYRGLIAAVEHGALLQTDRRPLPTRLLRRFDRFLGARAVDVHVAVSDFLRERINSARRPVVTIPNGVDLDVYRPSSSPRSEDEFVIGCMSRLIPGKGVEDVIVAAQEAISRGARLRIAGDGPERARLERLAEQAGIRESVEFVGWMKGASDVAAFWNTCDIAVAAPNDWVESFGLAAVEAMACATPVVATRGGALSETVVQGRTGFLVEPRDTHALASALLAYLDDPSLVTTHGAAAREWCKERFNIQRCARAYADLFRAHSAPGLSEGTATRDSDPPQTTASAIGPRAPR
jgi:glycosyltransferase involved in cell wall biosynthesis/GT2 family glycosyltransferase